MLVVSENILSPMSRIAYVALLAAACLPGFEGKSDLSRSACLACQDACDGKYCPKVCAGKTAQGDDMTCALDNDCLDNAIDPYGGMGCNVRRLIRDRFSRPRVCH